MRKLAVEMHTAAYGALGVGYKLRHGYYTSMARHAASGMSKAARKPRVYLPLVGLIGAVACVVVAARRRGSS